MLLFLIYFYFNRGAKFSGGLTKGGWAIYPIVDIVSGGLSILQYDPSTPSKNLDLKQTIYKYSQILCNKFFVACLASKTCLCLCTSKYQQLRKRHQTFLCFSSQILNKCEGIFSCTAIFLCYFRVREHYSYINFQHDKKNPLM